jgi:hypothetical protein
MGKRTDILDHQQFKPLPDFSWLQSKGHHFGLEFVRLSLRKTAISSDEIAGLAGLGG